MTMTREFYHHTSGPGTRTRPSEIRAVPSLHQANTLQDSLHPILNYMADDYGGFNIFRRFRLTHLVKCSCPIELKHFWAGHAPKHVSEHYTRLAEERDYRLMWAEKIGLGFGLPNSTKKSHFGQLVQFRKAV